MTFFGLGPNMPPLPFLRLTDAAAFVFFLMILLGMICTS